MTKHPLFKPLATAALTISTLIVLAVGPLKALHATLASSPLALVQRAENAENVAPILWVDTGIPVADASRSRGDLARAILNAHSAGARAILLATPLDQPSDSADLARVHSILEGAGAARDANTLNRLTQWAAELDRDAQLEQAIASAGHVVLLSENGTQPLTRFVSAAHSVGLEPAVPNDADGISRRDALFGLGTIATRKPSASFALWLAAHGANSGDIRTTRSGIELRKLHLDTDAAGGWVPNYGQPVGVDGGITRITLADLADNKISKTQLRDHVLVMGRGVTKVTTALNTTESLGEALTQRYASLEAGNYFVKPRFAQLLSMLLLLGAIGFASIYAPSLPATRRLAFTLITCFTLLLIEVLLLATVRVWLPLLSPAIALLITTLAVWLAPTYSFKRPVRAASDTISTWARTLPRREIKRPVVPAKKPSANQSAATGTRVPEDSAPDTGGAIMSLREISDSLKASLVEPTPSEVADLLLGRSKRRPKPRLGRYELDRELGKGAMGTVFLARDPRINRIVALKAIPIVEEFADRELDEVRARFFREAEMAGRLNHPAIVTVYDAGEDNGIAWIAMEYIDGVLLSEFSSSDRLLPPEKVLEIIARAADALDYAHAQDVIHRDIKPANILFIPETLETRLTDFGIARLTNSSSTRSGIVLGTPSFMAPEQLDGRTVTGFSDIFALGVTLFQLLTGQLPFRADSMTALMEKIANAEPPPLRTIRPDLPNCCAAIVSQALAKNPSERFASAGDMARALRACARTVKG